MKKKRFVIFILTTILIITMFIVSFVHYNFYEKYKMVYYAIMFASLIPNYFVRKEEQRESTQILFTYYIEANPEKFISLITDYNKSLFVKSRKYKNAITTTISNAYLDCGKYNLGYDTALTISEYEQNMSITERVFYYGVYIKYFLRVNNYKKARQLMDEVRSLIQKSNNREKIVLENYLRYLVNCYNVLNGIYLDQAYEYFEQLQKNRINKIMMIECSYYLGLINKSKEQYYKAKEEFKKIIAVGGNLVYVDLSTIEIKKLNYKETEQ